MTYDDMARTLGIDWCDGRSSDCHMRHVLEGSVSHLTATTIHITDRTPSKSNTLAFLKLVARAEDPGLDVDPAPWRRVYLINVRVRSLARMLHIGNPAHPARMDRAFVLASVAGISNEVPMRKKAYDWARRGPERKKEENDARSL